MKRALLAAALVLLVVGGVVALTSGGGGGGGDPTYKIEFDNAFGLVTGAQFKVAGVPAGSIQAINLNRRDLHAVVTVSVTQSGFGAFHQDATCSSEPESLIGEYFVDCNPGSSGPTLRNGATIPVTHTTSTIPGDLLQDIMRLPYRERFALIIDELGAAVGGNSQNLQAALQRAVPALNETDNLLNLLANNSDTLKQLTADSDQVITALANNSVQVQRFIQYANRAAVDSAAQQHNIELTFQRLPGFLSELRPTLAKLDTAVKANQPVLVNLHAASGTLDRFFTDLPGFAHASLPATRALGKASVVGKTAVTAAGPTVQLLNQFALHNPELAQNLAIVTQHLDNRAYATEHNPRSPGGLGYTGLEALLQFVFNFSLGINTYGPYGHMLAVDAFYNPVCSPYADAQTITQNVAQYGLARTEQCFSWLGPNQPGVNEPDPTDPSACVPLPGGAPPGQRGPAPSGTACTASNAAPAIARRSRGKPSGRSTSGRSTATAPARGRSRAALTGPLGGAAPVNLSKTVGKVLSLLGGSGATSAVGAAGKAAAGTTSAAGAGQSSSNGGGSGTQQLLNYLLSP
jgi:virulence factor Mce-like protein